MTPPNLKPLDAQLKYKFVVDKYLDGDVASNVAINNDMAWMDDN